MSRKTFYIILITLAGLLIVGGLIWYFFSKPSTPAATTTDSAGFTLPGQKTTPRLVPISEGPVAQAAENPKPGTKSAVFSPDAKKIAYYISDLKNNSLFISDTDGKNQKTLIKALSLRDIILSWPKTNQIALISRPSGLATGGLWLFDIGASKLTKVISDLPGLEAVFSPDGDNFIYSFVDQNGQNPILAVYKNGASKNISNISTLIDKCAWSGDSINIYCAIPKSWPDSAVLPDDYYKNALSTIDNIWKINTETGAKNIIFENMGDISNIAISGGGDSLIFILRNNGFLYKLDLE